jgi:hypothetical protein
LNVINDEPEAVSAVLSLDSLIIAVTSTVDLVQRCAKFLEVSHDGFRGSHVSGRVITRAFDYLLAEWR